MPVCLEGSLTCLAHALCIICVLCICVFNSFFIFIKKILTGEGNGIITERTIKYHQEKDFRT